MNRHLESEFYVYDLRLHYEVASVIPHYLYCRARWKMFSKSPSW